MESSEKAHDNLTAIAGIKQARQQWLRESFNVRTYQDLASLSVDQIESRLRADGQIASRSAIEAWLIRAREFAASAGGSPVPELEPTDGQRAKQASSLSREDGWKPFASFVVEFQDRELEGRAGERRTAVHHMERDTGTEWPGIESKKLCQWMLDQIRDKLESEPGAPDASRAQLAAPTPAAKASAELAIRQIRIFQPPRSETATHAINTGEPFEGLVKGDAPFTLHVGFEIGGPAAAIAREQIECKALSYVYDEAKDTDIKLGETGPTVLERGERTHTFRLPEATLSPGRYRLWVLVTPQDATLATPDYIEVPLLQVV